jgi:PIN domain nuclease of toxin-antitoxin system
MKLSLDTRAFIWWDSQSSRLSARVLAACADPANELLLSVANVWEMQIKVQLGKLQLRAPLARIIEEQERTNRIRILQISIDHVLAVGNLLPLHRDPFDRLEQREEESREAQARRRRKRVARRGSTALR